MRCRTTTAKTEAVIALSLSNANGRSFSVDDSVWDPLCVPCAEWMCDSGHELDIFAGNCLMEETEGGEGDFSMDFILEYAEGMENGGGSYSFEFWSDIWSSSPHPNRCSDLICCTGESPYLRARSCCMITRVEPAVSREVPFDMCFDFEIGVTHRFL